MNPPDLPIGLQPLADKLKYKYLKLRPAAGLDLFAVNLTDLNLSLTDTNPCIWVRAADIQSSDPINLAYRLMDAAREMRWEQEAVLVFMDAPLPALRDHLPEALPVWVLIDDAQQRQIQTADSPSYAFIDALLGQMPRSQLAPYEVSKPVTGSRFFGRKREISDVLRRPENNFIFVGIRRMGKTSLLREIERRLDENLHVRDGHKRSVYVDCSVIETEEDFLLQIASALDPTSRKQILSGRAVKAKRARTQLFKQFAALHGGRITYLLDELDKMLEKIGVRNDLFESMRAASTEGSARYIMAGYNQAMQAYNNDLTAFFNMLDKPIEVSALDEDAIRRMILFPMGQLRVTFSDPDALVSRIYQETSGLPIYVQHYCKILLDYLDANKRSTLNVDDIAVVYSNLGFRYSIVETFEGNNGLLERIIVYALFAKDERSTRDRIKEDQITALLRKQNLNLRSGSLTRACRNLVRAEVLKDEGRGTFRVAVPLLRHALHESTNIDYTLRRMIEEFKIDPRYSDDWISASAANRERG
jgi:hypothetical protein